jgi:chromosomal replication initiator protein
MRISPQQFNSWFADARLKSLDASNLAVTVPTAQARRQIERYYAEILLNSAEYVLGRRPLLSISVEEGADVCFMQIPSSDFAVAPNFPETGSAFIGGPDIILNRRYTFDNFVVGPSNRLAHAAGLAVAESATPVYNPLFIHGSVGMGKTHLLQAICHYMLKNRSRVRILYLSCENFINHFITAVKTGELDQFRYKYRSVDVLLVDDIHNLSNKEGTQEEFFHTFNTLYNAQKQIVLSSDSSPKEIPKLEERLVSRFKWGLEARLDAPDFETRMAIIQNKAKLSGRDVPDSVFELLAKSIDSNIRELEGAITTVIGYASLTNRPVTLELAYEALKSTLERAPLKVSLAGIQEAVCDYFGVRLSELQGKKRSKSVVFPRQLAMFLARNLTDLSLEEIGSYFGGRDHTTVMHSTEKIKELLERDENLRSAVSMLEKRARENAAAISPCNKNGYAGLK